MRQLLSLTTILMLTITAAAVRAADLPNPAALEARLTIPGSKYTDVFGKVMTLSQSQPVGGGGSPAVFIFINTECPISNKAIPELNRLAALAAKNKIEFYGVLSDPTVSRPAAQKYSRDFQISFPILFDASGTLAAALQPAVTPHVFILDPVGKLLYTGRINDAYIAVGTPRPSITSNDLQDALTALIAGKNSPKPTTTPIGCIFESWKRPAKDAKVTWSRDLAPVVYANCSACHHDGEVAPFSLMSFQDASKRAEMLAHVTASHQMPPWKAVETWGTFHDERRLTSAQITLFQQWADAGAPEGDKADAPPAPTYKESWELGTPDLIVKMVLPVTVPAAGRDIMAYNVIPLNLPEDKYIVAFEYRPGNRKVVHHMIALLDANGNARQLAKDKGNGSTYINFGGPEFLPTGSVGGWAPGVTPRFLPDGVAHPLRKGSDLILQVHYHPSGKTESDQGQLALYFAKKPVKQTSITFPLANRQININPGDGNYTRTAQITTPANVTLFGITPHMHNLGREMKVTATFPDGHTQQLIYIDDWDWNWQDQYQYAQPIKLPAGTKVDLWARYDNSKDNPRNPQNPPQRVTYGEQTSNEMCIAFLAVTVDGLRAPLLDPGATSQPGNILQRLQQLRGNRGEFP